MLELLGLVFLFLIGFWILKGLFGAVAFTIGGIFRVLLGLFLLALFVPALLVFFPVIAVVGFLALGVLLLVVTVLATAFIGLFS